MVCVPDGFCPACSTDTDRWFVHDSSRCAKVISNADEGWLPIALEREAHTGWRTIRQMEEQPLCNTCCLYCHCSLVRLGWD